MLICLKPKNGFMHPEKWPLACPDWKGRPLLVRDWSAIDPSAVFLQWTVNSHKQQPVLKQAVNFFKNKMCLHMRCRLRWATTYKETLHTCTKHIQPIYTVHAAMYFSQTEKYTQIHAYVYICAFIHLQCKSKYLLYSVKILLVGSKKQHNLAIIILLWILAFVWLMQSTCAVILKKLMSDNGESGM